MIAQLFLKFFLTLSDGLLEVIRINLNNAKDSFINLDQDLLKVAKISGQVESTVQVKITQKWIKIFWLYFLSLKI